MLSRATRSVAPSSGRGSLFCERRRAVPTVVPAAEVDDKFWAHAGEDVDVDLSGSYD